MKKVKIGEIVKVKLPASEICMHMRIVDKIATVYLVSSGRAIVQLDNDPCPITMLPSEAGIRFNNGEYTADVVEGA
jgi:hypothetical protein